MNINNWIFARLLSCQHIATAPRKRFGMICKRLIAILVVFLALQATRVFESRVYADELTVLSSDEAALRARFALIEQAQSEICLASYTIDDSVLVKEVTEQLGRKSKAGVRVRVIVDGLSSARFHKTIQSMCFDGVEVRIYHPIGRARPDWLNRRMHSKLLVVDRSATIVGSRNMVEKHFGLSTLNFVDIDAMVVGESSCVVAKYFDKLWDSPDVLPPFSLISMISGTRMSSECEPRITPLADCVMNSSLEGSSINATCFVEAHEVCVLHDDLCGSARAGSVSAQVNQMIDAAQRSVVIDTPYPAFSNEFFDRIKAACGRGVCVTLVTNSLCSTNQVEVFAAYQNQKTRLLEMGVRIFEFRGPDHLHAKAMVVDDQLAMVGSYNFDARSEHLNLELSVLTNNPTAVMLISQSIVNHQCQTKSFSSTSESDTIVEASLLRRLRMRTAQFVVPMLRPAL